MGGTEALILTALTSGAQFLSAQSEARSAKRERDANVQAEANANAVVMEQMERQRRRQLGSTTAALSRSGVTVDTGSALDVLFDTDQELLLDKAIENFNSRNRQMQLYNKGNEKIGAARARAGDALFSMATTGISAASGGFGGAPGTGGRAHTDASWNRFLSRN